MLKMAICLSPTETYKVKMSNFLERCILRSQNRPGLSRWPGFSSHVITDTEVIITWKRRKHVRDFRFLCKTFLFRYDQLSHVVAYLDSTWKIVLLRLSRSLSGELSVSTALRSEIVRYLRKWLNIIQMIYITLAQTHDEFYFSSMFDYVSLLSLEILRNYFAPAHIFRMNS